MKIECFRIQNFRRLKSTLIDLENEISIFVGSNNSGKTSAVHILDIFINGKKDNLSLYDFTTSCWREINEIGDEPQKSIENGTNLPTIILDLWFTVEENDLHRVLDLLPEMDWKGKVVGVRIEFKPKDNENTLQLYMETKNKVGRHNAEDAQSAYRPWPKNLADYLGRTLKDEYEFSYYALDRARFDEQYCPEDGYVPFSFKPEHGRALIKSLIRVDTMYAQRYLSDQASNGRAEDLSKCLSRFYKRNLEKRDEDHQALGALYNSEAQFNAHLKSVFGLTLGKIKDLGYPGVLNPKMVIRSALNPTLIMNQDTRVHYSLDESDDSLTLPDNYSGLGFKNLIYMLVELLDVQTRWLEEEENRSLMQLIVIEEPEAHLHAQLQQVFIRKILDILKIEGEDAQYYSTQIAITTHSPHILFEKGFKPIRYFRREGTAGIDQHSISLNVSEFYRRQGANVDFLERYMKLTHCDLFFADAVVLVEGTVERVLLPLMIEKCAISLQSSYLSIMEVGGAYSYRFKSLIEFLGIPALVITDLDSVLQRKEDDPAGDDEDSEAEIELTMEEERDGGEKDNKKYRIGKACMPHTTDSISANQTLIQWLPKKILIRELLATDVTELIQMPSENGPSTIRVCYQQEVDVEWEGAKGRFAGRTLEEAFALENVSWSQEEKREHLLLRIKHKPQSLEGLVEKIHRRVKAKSFNKTTFALGVLSEDPALWNIPTYIKEGLQWLENLLAKETTTPVVEEIPMKSEHTTA
ncbi:AAA family ATPase [Chitinophaga polysaccharea]|uniref:ATP-dependent nuclease n=1 Tax=Chitinophaga polysaccharea TaxID=1293035 RepID=UPI001455A74D|nr:ATP-dependent endonuclease [Chitinophaga polysaccharea]NLR56932.1 AAA family ATPase [Chitinophaga polysaccharea]